MTDTSRLGGWYLAALLLAGTLVFDPWGWAAFGPAKWGALSVIGLLGVGVVARARSISVHRTSAVGWAGFVLWGALAGVVAVDPIHAWIGTPDRHFGLFAVVLAGVAFMVGQQVTEVQDVARAVRAGVVCLLGIGAYSALELLGVRPVDVTFAGGRLGGPFGTPAYLGAACALLLPIALGMALDGDAVRQWGVGAAVAAGLGLVAAVGSQTRGAWVGLAVASAITVVVIRPVKVRSRWLVLAAVAAVLLVVGLSPLGGRVASTFEAGGGAQGRADEWQVGVRALGAHAVTGTGFEGYRIVFGEHAGDDYERRYGRAVIPDRAHNGAIDIGIVTGVPGLLLYLGAVALIGVRARRALRSGRPWLIGLGAGVLAYVVQQQFLFPVAEIDIAFWGLVGLLVAITPAGEAVVSAAVPRVVTPVALVLIGAALVAAGLDVAADHEVKSALADSASGRSEQALTAADRAADLRPDSIRYWFAAATVAARSGSGAGLDAALRRFDRGLDISPGDPILLREWAATLLTKARRSGDAGDIMAAVDAWEGLVATDPNNARNRLELGVAYAAANRLMEAEAAWLEAAHLSPTSGAPWVNLAVLYLESDRPMDARAALEQAEALDPEAPGLGDVRNRIEEEIVS